MSVNVRGDGDRASRAVTVLAAVAIAAGLFLVAKGMAWLPDAHLYRQSSGEGMMFAQVLFLAVPGSALAAGGAVALLAAGRRLGQRARIVTTSVAVGTALVLIACVAASLWVEAHGDRCIGACG